MPPIEISVTVWGSEVLSDKNCSVFTHVLSTLSAQFVMSILYEITVAKRPCNDEQDAGLKLSMYNRS